MSRFDRLRRKLGVQQQLSPGNKSTNESINMDELRKDCWLGIPHKLRPLAWRILSVNHFIIFYYFLGLCSNKF